MLPAVSVEANTWLHFFFPSMYNETIIRFGFCDIQTNEGLWISQKPHPIVVYYLDGHQHGHGVSIQISTNLGKHFLLIFCLKEAAAT